MLSYQMVDEESIHEAGSALSRGQLAEELRLVREINRIENEALGELEPRVRKAYQETIRSEYFRVPDKDQLVRYSLNLEVQEAFLTLTVALANWLTKMELLAEAAEKMSRLGLVARELDSQLLTRLNEL